MYPFFGCIDFLLLEKNEVTETCWLCLLQVRQNPKEGSFFVQNLKRVAVVDYPDIERRIEEGMICSSINCSDNSPSCNISEHNKQHVLWSLTLMHKCIKGVVVFYWGTCMHGLPGTLVWIFLEIIMIFHHPSKDVTPLELQPVCTCI